MLVAEVLCQVARRYKKDDFLYWMRGLEELSSDECLDGDWTKMKVEQQRKVIASWNPTKPKL